MKSRIILFLAMFLLLSINDAFTQNRDGDGDIITVAIRDGIPVKRILVVNGILVRDSLISVRLKSELVNFKTKTKTQRVSETVAKELGIEYNPDKLGYKFEIIEIKDAILDPETMKLIKIK